MYTQFYNFSEKPFNLTPDPKFLYLTASHREALASMLYGINERKGFITVTGEIGVGKTTLIYTLFKNLNKKIKTVFVSHTTTTFHQLLVYILLTLNITVDIKDKILLLERLNDYLTQNVSDDGTLAIIVDEAQNMPDMVMEELRLLSNLETSKRKLLQILLVGQPELETKLNSQELRQLKQRIAIKRTIKPLSPEESKEYIDHRLKTVGSSSETIFSSGAASLICKHAEGIPRVINIICDNALLIGYGFSQKKITRKIVKEALNDLSDHSKVFPNSNSLFSFFSGEAKIISQKVMGIVFSGALLISLILFALIRQENSVNNPLQKNAVIQTPIVPEPTATSVVTSTQPKPSIKEITKQLQLQQDTIKERPFSKQILAKPRTEKTTLNKEGGSLYSIALNQYRKANPTIYDFILKANPDINDIRKISDNQEIVLPVITRESFIRKSNNTYEILAGTFAAPKLAKDFSDKLIQLGKHPKIQTLRVSPKDTWYQVTLANFDTKESALKMVKFFLEKKLLLLP